MPTPDRDARDQARATGDLPGGAPLSAGGDGDAAGAAPEDVAGEMHASGVAFDDNVQTEGVYPRPWPVAWLALRLIAFYRRFISPMMPPACRFTPTCSEYGYEAIAKYGIIRGGRLAVWRILRCNPFGRGGYDPVN